MTELELQSVEMLVSEYRKKLIEDIERRKRISLTSNSADKYEYYRTCIADYFGMSKEKAFNINSREEAVMLCRHILAWICKVGETSLPYNFQALAYMIGYKSHSSVVHSINEIQARLMFTHSDRVIIKNILDVMGYELAKEGDSYTNKLKA